VRKAIAVMNDEFWRRMVHHEETLEAGATLVVVQPERQMAITENRVRDAFSPRFRRAPAEPAPTTPSRA
jgi:hypothetical protein